MRLGILASHEGTTLQALMDACNSPSDVEVAIVISNNSGSGALRRAREAGIPAMHLSGRTHPDLHTLDAAIADTLTAHHVDLVVLAGYMKKLGPRTLATFEGRIVNTHPALLPKYGGQGMFGLNVHRAVLEGGDRVTGVSVHLVTEEYDAGPVMAQLEVPVDPGDTPESLAARVQAAERQFLVDVLFDVARGAVELPVRTAAPPPRERR